MKRLYWHDWIPNLPNVSDFFSAGGRDYLVMDFVPGKDLRALINEARQKGTFLPEREVLNWASQIADALSYLHSQKPPILHRDIKPSNLKLTPSPAYIFRRGILAWWAGMLLGDTETVLHAIDRKLHDEVNEYAMKRNGDNSYVVVVEIDIDDLLLDDESAKRLIRMYEASKRFPDQDVMSGPCEIRYNGTITPDQIKGIIQVVHTGL